MRNLLLDAIDAEDYPACIRIKRTDEVLDSAIAKQQAAELRWIEAVEKDGHVLVKVFEVDALERDESYRQGF